jgi:hypothetical protein
MSSIQLLITLPADANLADLVEQRLAPHAEVLRPPPQSFEPTMLLIASLIAATGASVAAAGASLAAIQQSRAATQESKAALLKTILEIKQMLAQQGQAAQARIGTPAAGTRTFAEADEAFLRRLLEADA